MVRPDRLALRVFHCDVKHVVAGARRIGIQGDLDEKIARVERIERGWFRLAGREQCQQYGETVTALRERGGLMAGRGLPLTP